MRERVREREMRDDDAIDDDEREREREMMEKKILKYEFSLIPRPICDISLYISRLSQTEFITRHISTQH